MFLVIKLVTYWLYLGESNVKYVENPQSAGTSGQQIRTMITSEADVE